MGMNEMLLIFVGSDDGSIVIYGGNDTPNGPDLMVVQCMEGYHKDKISCIIVYYEALITCSYDRTIKVFSKDNQMMHEFEDSVSTMSIVSNKKGKDVLVVGFTNGMVSLYEDFQFNEYGRLLRHKGK